MKFIEFVKTVLIVVLLVLAGCLTAILTGYGGVGSSRVIQSEPMAAIPLATERTLVDGSQPLTISVKNQQGRTTIAGDFALLDSGYEALGSFLAQALDSADQATSMEKDQFFTQVATEQGIYFAFPTELNLSLLTQWLDGDMKSDLSGRLFFLQPQGNSVKLLVLGEEAYGFATQIDSQSMLRAMEGYVPDGTYFAAEQSSDTQLYPLAILGNSTNTIQAATSQNPCDGAFALAVASEFRFNPYDESKYLDATGATVYNESDCTLRITLDGQLTLENLEKTSQYTAQSGSKGDQIDYVYALLEDIFRHFTTDGRLFFQSYEVSGTENIIRFDYYLGGIPVLLSQPQAVTARFYGDTLLSLDVSVRQYTLSQEQVLTYLPLTQASALTPTQTEMTLAYGDLTRGALTVGWKQGKGELYGK